MALGRPPLQPAWQKTLEDLANPPWMKAFQHLAEPPWMKALESLTEPPRMKTMQNLAEPPWMKNLGSLAEPPWMKAFENLAEPPWMKALENLADPPWRKALENFAEPAWVKGLSEHLGRQQKLFDGLLQAPDYLTVRAGWSGGLPDALLEQLAAYRDEVVSEAATQAEAAVEYGISKAETLSRLATERQAILICLKRIFMIAEGARLAEVPVPGVVVLMLLMFVLLGEAADEMLREREEQSQSP
jgi:hypothetical protein